MSFTYVYIPDTLNIVKHFHKLLDLEKAYWIISYIRRGNAMYGTAKGAYVPVNQQKLMSQIGRYKPILQTLLDNDVITCDGEYHCGRQHKSLGYRLADDLYDCSIRRLDLKILKVKKPELSMTAKKLEYWLQQLTIEDDINPCDMVALDEDGEVIDYSDYIMKLRNGDWEVSEDKHGRLYSIFSRLPSKLRKYLRLNGEKLVSRDISNSHPWLLGLVMANTTYDKQADRYFLPSFNVYNTNTVNYLDFTGDYDQFFKKEEEDKIHIPHMIDTCPAITQIRELDDVRQWIALSSSGSFYQQVAIRTSTKQKPKTIQDIKKEYLLVNGEKRHEPKWLKKLFPTVEKVVRHMKRNVYQDFARYLLSLEAKINLHCVASEIMKKYPAMPLLTIHDCFYTTPQWADILDQQLDYHYSALQVKPRFKAKDSL